MRPEIQTKIGRCFASAKSAHTILNRFNISVKHFLSQGANVEALRTSRKGSPIIETLAAARLCGGTLHNLAAGLSPQEQPVKSSSAAVVVAPAVTFSGIAVPSLLVV